MSMKLIGENALNTHDSLNSEVRNQNLELKTLNSSNPYPGLERILQQHTRKAPFGFTEPMTLKEILELEHLDIIEGLSRGEMQFLGRKVAQICEYVTETTIYREKSGQPKYTPENYPIVISVFEQFLDENY